MAIAKLVRQHFTAASESVQMQPMRDATPLVLLCSHFDPQSYSQLHSNAAQLLADVTAVASWLSQLSDCCTQSVSSQLVDGGSCLETTPGLVIMDISSARATLMKMAGTTLG